MTASPGPAALPYRPEIDGLRAIAVAAVMLFHADLAGAGGGFSGVDVFFVISGYLITRILRRRETGERGLAAFYLRRARRILPALFVVLGTTSAVALLLPTAAQLERFGTSLLAALAFVANLYLWRGGHDYFAPASAEMPLSHLWSLAIEEQFYLVFPPLLLVLLRRRTRMIVPVLAIIAGLSFASAEWLNDTAPAAAYYAPITRAWELLAGALLATLGNRGALPGHRAPDVAAAAGLAMVVAPIWLIDRSTPFPGLAAIPSVAGTLMILRYARADRGVGRVLASRPFVALGLVSYGAFLWHQPVLAFARILPLDAATVPWRCAALALSIALAAAMWRWIERPIRRPARPRDRRFVAAMLACALVLAGVGAVFRLSHGLPARLDARATALARMTQGAQAEQSRCYIEGDRTIARACVVGATGRPPSIALIGDSHAAAIAPAFDRAGKDLDRAVMLLPRSGCPPIPGLPPSIAVDGSCARMREAMIAHVLRSPRIDTVVLAARWPLYFERSRADNGEGGVEIDVSPAPIDDAARRAMPGRIATTVGRLLRHGKRVILVYPVPEAGWDVPMLLAKADRYGVALPRPLTIDAARVRARDRAARAALDAIGTAPGLARLDPARLLCAADGGRRCLLTFGIRPLYFDDDHLSALGVRVALPPDVVAASIDPSAFGRRTPAP